jgi:MFS family permease
VTARSHQNITLGLRANWHQFALLVLINGFVGAMVGLERTVLPLIGARDFGLASATAALSFIVSFGLAKAIANLAAGWLVERRGRHWTLIIGWLAALPVPLLILYAPSWSWVVVANVLLGVNQGLAWSTTVIMKVDLVGPRRRGLAMGLNEFAGYVAVGAAALASGYAASRFGLREGVAWLGLPIAVLGLALSAFAVRDTTPYARLENEAYHETRGPRRSIKSMLKDSLWFDRSLFSLSQAGFVNNLNDGVAWGIFPLLLARTGFSLVEIGFLAALYPTVWGSCQILTGWASDRWGRKRLIVSGMILQGVALLGITAGRGLVAWTIGLVALGVGTAMVYPTLLAGVADSHRPSVRAGAIGVYRLWRDLGYVAGALLAGVVADAAGLLSAIRLAAILTIASGLVAAIRYHDAKRRDGQHPLFVTRY